MSYIPTDINELNRLGHEQADFVLVTGDAYIDHPSFGSAIIAKYLMKFGYSVGIIAQPDYKTTDDFMKFGKPRLGFLITSGNIDSMVNHYSVNKKRRKDDLYTPNNVNNKRPDRAVIVYANKVKEAYKDVPIILGGIEASLRRFAHYDYWQDKVRRSILLDSKADMIVYGMGERTIIEVADSLNSGLEINDITYISGTVYKTKNIDDVYNHLELPSYEDITSSKQAFMKSFLTQEKHQNFSTGKALTEQYGNQYVVQNPPQKPLSRQELDDVFAMDFERKAHPMYDNIGHIKAIDEVKFSINYNRGCLGGCNFCALAYHQGKEVVSRTKESVVNEAKQIIDDPDFKGYIHDIGGPTANFTSNMCDKMEKAGACTHQKCLASKPCDQLKVDHFEYLNILREVRQLEGVKKVFVRSGLRYDYLVNDKNDAFINELAEHHVSGQLRIAPEHISKNALRYMGKPSKHVYFEFVEKFDKINKKIGKDQYIVPYLMSSHPGCTLDDAIELAMYLHDINHQPLQVQDFYPTPSTLSTAMYYTELSPYTLKKMYVPKTREDKEMQRALMQYRNPKNKLVVEKALKKAKRQDLIKRLK
jgi:uncharacterized radical SAM protein YgiQ